MPDFAEVFAKLDSHKAPARHRDALLASIEDAYCDERARERLTGVELVAWLVVLVGSPWVAIFAAAWYLGWLS